MLPAESIAFETLERLLPEIENLDHQLLTLAQKGWIAMETGTDKSGGDFKSPPDSDAGYFKCSPVVQEVVKWKNPDLLNDCQSLVKVLIKELDDETIHIDNYQHSTRFARYAETVVRVWSRNHDDLGTLCQNIGDFHTATGNLGKAMSAYQKMTDIYSALIAENPDHPDFKNGLAISYSQLGQFYRDQKGDKAKARLYFEQCQALHQELAKDHPGFVEFQRRLKWVQNALADLDK